MIQFPTLDIRRRSGVLASERVRLAVFVIFLACVFLLGGSSREDSVYVVLLRPLAVLFGAYALSIRPPGAISRLGAPLYLLVGLALIMVAQLIPLPPALWSALPGRDVYFRGLALAGADNQWRPASLAPSRTLNSLMSLVVPAAALLLLAVQERRYFRMIILGLLSLAVLSAIWGIAQLIGSADGPLYIHKFTNTGLPVGLMANRNHQAVFLAAVLPIFAYFGSTAFARGTYAARARLGAAAGVLLLVTVVLLSGSRAGLIGLLLGMGESLVILYWSPSGVAFRKAAMRQLGTRLIIVSGAGLFVLAIAAVYFFDRIPAVDRAFSASPVEELRFKILPILLKMATDFFPVGTGFGAFADTFYAFEPVALLRDTYLNNAHNDGMQLLIEGGLPGVVLLVATLVWLSREAFFTIIKASRGDSVNLARISMFSAMLVLAAGSFLDYPLRVPAIMVFVAVLAGLLGLTGKSQNPEPGAGGSA